MIAHGTARFASSSLACPVHDPRIVELQQPSQRRILVLYGTTEGHTEMIATAIGNTLIARGCDVNVIQAGTIDPRPADYDGIIVAASVHRGHYQAAVARWIGAHVLELRAKPTALVSACLGVLRHDPHASAELDAIVHQFIDPLGWQPTVIKTVAGAVPYTKFHPLMRWIVKRIAARAGGDTDTSRDYDYTDWKDLRAFAEEFGRRVAATRRPNSPAKTRKSAQSV